MAAPISLGIFASDTFDVDKFIAEREGEDIRSSMPFLFFNCYFAFVTINKNCIALSNLLEMVRNELVSVVHHDYKKFIDLTTGIEGTPELLSAVKSGLLSVRDAVAAIRSVLKCMCFACFLSWPFACALNPKYANGSAVVSNLGAC